MKIRRKQLRKSAGLLNSRDFARIEAAFAIRIIKSNPITPERLAIAESKALRSRDAKSANFLDIYRLKAHT